MATFWHTFLKSRDKVTKYAIEILSLVMPRKSVCSVAGCGKGFYKGRGFCERHFRLWLIHGDPLGGTRRSGKSKHPLIWTWRDMIRRCHDETHESFHSYGGRGIKVCERWRNDFWVFVADMGPKPSSERTLERIDNDGDYCPANCKWATALEQSRNKRTNRHIIVNGQTQIMSQWARDIGVNRAVVYKRIARGWSLEDAISRPSQRHPRLQPTA